MSEITSELLEVSVDTDATVEIDSKLPEAAVDVTKSITVEIQPENYVLTSGGIYTGNLTGATPTWLLNAIQQQLTTGDGNITSVLNDMQLLLDDLQLGVNQAISQIENTNTSLSALETSLSSRINENSADILDVYATRVTADEAQAIATTAIGTTFNGNVDAYIANLASVYTAPGSATATNINTLQTSYNDQTARIDSIEYATTDEFGYSLGASKLGTSPDGSIVGWQFTDGTGVQSEFKIQAEKFSISDGTTGYTPFLIDGTNIKFNGLVEFSNISGGESILTTGEAAADINANTTTIDGGKITTGSITANQIDAYAISGKTIAGGTINGTTINGSNIIGSVIKASWIDYTSTGTLTNWQYFTPSTVPSEYINNFARNNTDNSLIVDSDGYVRLPKVLPVVTAAHNFSHTGDTTYTSPVFDFSIHSYNSYTINTTSRLLNAAGLLTMLTGSNEHQVCYVRATQERTTPAYAIVTMYLFGIKYVIYLKTYYNKSTYRDYYITQNGSYIVNVANEYNMDDKVYTITANGLTFKVEFSSIVYYPEGGASRFAKIKVLWVYRNINVTLNTFGDSTSSIQAYYQGSGISTLNSCSIDIPSLKELS